MREVAHLQGAELLVQRLGAQAALHEPKVRAGQIAFDLRGRKAGPRRLAVLPPARQHHQGTPLGPNRPDGRAFDLRGNRLFAPRDAKVLVQAFLAAFQHAAPQRGREQVGVVDVVGRRRVVPIAVHQLLDDHGGIRGFGCGVEEAPLDHQLRRGNPFERVELAACLGQRVVGLSDAQLAQKRRARVLAVGHRAACVRHVAEHEHVARTGRQGGRERQVADEHVGIRHAHARRARARDVHRRLREHGHAGVRPLPHASRGLQDLARNPQRGQLFVPIGLRHAGQRADGVLQRACDHRRLGIGRQVLQVRERLARGAQLRAFLARVRQTVGAQLRVDAARPHDGHARNRRETARRPGPRGRPPRRSPAGAGRTAHGRSPCRRTLARARRAHALPSRSSVAATSAYVPGASLHAKTTRSSPRPCSSPTRSTSRRGRA